CQSFDRLSSADHFCISFLCHLSSLYIRPLMNDSYIRRIGGLPFLRELIAFGTALLSLRGQHTRGSGPWRTERRHYIRKRFLSPHHAVEEPKRLIRCRLFFGVRRLVAAFRWLRAKQVLTLCKAGYHQRPGT